MKFKRIEEGEARKIIKMIESGDREMVKLAAAILNIKERWRFSLQTIVIFNSLLVIASLSLVVFLGYLGAKWYLVPLILGWLLQVTLTFGMILSISDDRVKYDKMGKWILNES